MLLISLNFVYLIDIVELHKSLISLAFVMFPISLHFVNVPDFIEQKKTDSDPADPPIRKPLKTKDIAKINTKPLKQNQFSADTGSISQCRGNNSGETPWNY